MNTVTIARTAYWNNNPVKVAFALKTLRVKHHIKSVVAPGLELQCNSF